MGGSAAVGGFTENPRRGLSGGGGVLQGIWGWERGGGRGPLLP